MLKNTAGQRLWVFAFTLSNNNPKTLDGPNITCGLSKDGSNVVGLIDTNPTEVGFGLYYFNLDQDETNGEELVFIPFSDTSGIQVVLWPAVTTRELIQSSNVVQIADDAEAANSLRQLTYSAVCGIVVSATSNSVTLQGFTTPASHYPAGTLIVIRTDDINAEPMFGFVTSYDGDGVFNISPPWPVMPVADQLATVIPAPQASGGTGSGAYIVTITVTDADDNPLLGATVRMQSGVGYVAPPTDADGEASFSLDAGSYTLAVTLDGYAFAPVVLPITGNTEHTAELTLNVLNPDETQATLTAYDEDNNAAAGVIFQIALSAGPGTAGSSYPRTSVTVTSDANGLVTLPLLRSATYRIRRRVAANVWSDWTSFITTDTATYPIPEVLGRA